MVAGAVSLLPRSVQPGRGQVSERKPTLRPPPGIGHRGPAVASVSPLATVLARPVKKRQRPANLPSAYLGSLRFCVFFQRRIPPTVPPTTFASNLRSCVTSSLTRPASTSAQAPPPSATSPVDHPPNPSDSTHSHTREAVGRWVAHVGIEKSHLDLIAIGSAAVKHCLI
jgi:hypothetical protein